jgi:Armadillo/beta-catenin-like repeat
VADPNENGLPEAQARFLSAAVVELVHLFHGSGPHRVRVEAARVAAKLISTSVRLQQLACETGAVDLLVDYFPNDSSCPSHSTGPTASLVMTPASGRGVATQPRMSPVGNRAAPPGRSVWYLANRTPDDIAFRPRQRPRLVSQSPGASDAETRHPYPTDGPACELYQTGLSCLAALCSLWEPGREACITAGVLSIVVVALNHPADVAIVTAAVKCIRSLSRSVSILRRELVNANIAAPLRRLLNADSLDIRRQASACICNMILDFSPMKHALLSDGGIVALVALLRSEDPELRLNGLWALENATFNSDEAVKADVMNALGFERLAALCTHVCGQVSERALNLLRNLVFPSRSSSKDGQVNAVFQGMGPNLVHVLTAALVANSPAGVAENALYVVCNVASGTEAHKGLVMRSTLPEKILACLRHENERVRVAAVWCVINLCWNGSNDHATSSTDIAGALFPQRRHLYSQEAGRVGGTGLQGASYWEGLELVTRHHSTSQLQDNQESPSEERQVAAMNDSGGSQMESADPAEPDFKGDGEGDVAMEAASARNVDEPSVPSSSRDLRIDQLRAMGFELRLTTLLDDPAIEVAERARSALNFFVPGVFPDNSLAIANLVHSSGTSAAPESSSSDEMDS